MSCLETLMMPLRQSPIPGGWCKSVVRVLCLSLLALFVSSAISTNTAHAQHPPIFQVGGFNVQYWNQGDNGGSGAFMLGGGLIADANLGTFTPAQVDAIERALEYWTDVFNLPNATGQSPVIRFAIDAVTPNFNAFASSQGATVGGGQALTNTYNRLLNAANPQRADTVNATEVGIDGAVAFIPGGLGFDTAFMRQLPDLNSMEAIAIHEIGHLLGVANNVTIFDLNQALLAVQNNQAWANNVIDPNLPTSFFNGANVTALFGGNLPVQNPDTHFLLDFANLTRATPFGRDFRNVPQMSPLQLAAFADLGYPVVFADHFGSALYINGNGVQTATGGFTPTENFAHGIYVQSDNHNLLVNMDINVNGFAGTGVRLNGGQEPIPSPTNAMIGNTVEIANGTNVNANGVFGIGLLVSAGANHNLVHRGTINAIGDVGRGVVIDFSLGLLNFPGTMVGSSDYQAHLVDTFDITGAINTQGGLGTAIQIGDTAAVREINIMQGAVIGGNIVSNAFSSAGLSRPVLSFGRTPDANGRATDTPDDTFFLNYMLNISGDSATLQGELVGGETRFNGNVLFFGLTIGPDARLGGAGVITSATTVQQMGTIAPGNSIGTLMINGSLNSVGGTFDIEIQPGGPNPIPGVDNDLIIVTESTTLEGGTVNIMAAPGVYNVGERYAFILSGDGVTVGTRLAMFDNIPLRRVVQSADQFTFGVIIARDGVTRTLGRTFNQIAVGTYLDIVKDAPNADFQNVRDYLDIQTDRQTVLDALDQIAGDIHGTLALVSMQNSTQAYWLLSRQMQGACCGCDGTWDGWIVGYGRGGEVDYDGNAAGIDYTLGGTMFGAARCLGGPRVGFFGNYAGPSINSTVPMVHASARSYMLGGFFDGYDYLGHFLFAGAAGYDEYDVNRRIMFGPFNRMATSSYYGIQTSLYAEHDVDISYYAPNVRPYASMQYVNMYQDSFLETGAGSLNLLGSENYTSSLRSFVGVQLRSETLMANGWSCSPSLQFGWQHEFLNPSSLYNAQFAALGGPAAYTARGLDFGRNWGLVGLGLELVQGNHWSIYGGYDAYANGRQMLHTGSGSISFAW